MKTFRADALLTKSPNINAAMIGWVTLFHKEVKRFWRVAAQTIAAPIITTLLYLLIFSHALSDRVTLFGNTISYTAFLVPGLVMMSVLQNAFANSSSSLIQSKISGNLVFVLLAPISPFGFFSAYVLAGVLRGVMVGLGVWLTAALFFAPELWKPTGVLWIIAFTFLGSALLTMLGMIAGLWSEKFDQLSMFQNFIITPLTFLSGVFYSVKSLPTFWQVASKMNPFFYMIDGFRYGFFGVSDVPIMISFLLVLMATLVLGIVTWRLIARGWKIRP